MTMKENTKSLHKNKQTAYQTRLATKHVPDACNASARTKSVYTASIWQLPARSVSMHKTLY